MTQIIIKTDPAAAPDGSAARRQLLEELGKQGFSLSDDKPYLAALGQFCGKAAKSSHAALAKIPGVLAIHPDEPKQASRTKK